MQCGFSQWRHEVGTCRWRTSGQPSIQARRSVVCIGARFLTVVAADAETFVDQRHVGRFAQTCCSDNDQAAGRRVRSIATFFFMRTSTTFCSFDRSAASRATTSLTLG